MNTTPFRSLGGKPIFWTDRALVTHRCEGDDVHDRVRLIWTDCQRDVPANEAFICGSGTTRVDCPKCLAKERAA
jgi:hypothetical protein